MEQFNAPDLYFIVRASLPSGEKVLDFSMQQKCPRPLGRRSERRVYDQVKADLERLESTTGLTYVILTWGSPDWVYSWVREIRLHAE